ncbi:MAG: TIGR00296 family protein [Nitrososphaerales archaeon]|nr:TIGR00296 family protein [Nitrososphaerales archaeon]
MEISDKNGEVLVKLGREAIEKYVKEKLIIEPLKGLDPELYNKMGVFVTLNAQIQSGHKLRGCIGHPLPEKPLVEALLDSAIAAAVSDPRFDEVTSDELDNLVIEISILTPPEIIKVSSQEEYRNQIKVGEDGLIVKWQYGSGLLLPQVPTEQGWEVEEFLTHSCLKAGAPSDLWRSSNIDIYKFQAIIFDEVSPGGDVLRRKLE